MPDSSRFGYGGRVELDGYDPLSAIEQAGRYNLDWVAIDFDWQRLQPEALQTPIWAELDQAMGRAGESGLAVMISITQAPDWAMSADGPTPQRAAELAATLAKRYPGVLLALELFPFANTSQGWGARPNPSAYGDLLKATALAVKAINPEIVLVAGGLTPTDAAAESIEDLAFLEELYQTGAAEFMPVLGLRLPPMGSAPLAPSSESSQVVLRHYENIRQIMIDNGHKSDLLWITGFSWDANSLAEADEQAAWLKQAYLLFRSQLYIGVAFFDGLNPSQGEAAALFSRDGQAHPGFDELIQVIAQDHNSQTIEIQLEQLKKLSNKNHLKGN